MAPSVGLEPTTFGLKVRRSPKLSYWGSRRYFPLPGHGGQSAAIGKTFIGDGGACQGVVKVSDLM